jgi:preprotein translocase subunit YajC
MNWIGLFLTLAILWGSFLVVVLVLYFIGNKINKKKDKELQEFYEELQREIDVEKERSGNS